MSCRRNAQRVIAATAFVAVSAWTAPRVHAQGDERPDRGGEGEPPSVEEELQALEREVDASTSENAQDGGHGGGDGGGVIQNLNPDLSFIFQGGWAWTSVDPDDDGDDRGNDLGLQGGPDPKKFGFFFQALELNVQAAVDPYLDFQANIVLQPNGVVVEEAYGRTLSLPARLQVRFGKFKSRFGRVNEFHVHRWHFSTWPMVNAKFFGPRGLNGMGVEVSQLLPFPWYVEWLVAVQSFAGVRQGRSFVNDGNRIDGVLDLTVSSRVEQFFALSSEWSLQWGLNYAVGRNDAEPEGAPGGFRTDIATTDVYLKWKSTRTGGRSAVGWQSEAMYRRRETPGGVLEDAGVYSQIYWAPTRRWEVGARYGYTSEAGGPPRDYLDPEWIHGRHRTITALTHYPTEFSQFRLEYVMTELPSDFPQERLHMVIVRAQLVTGAHGAHEF